MVNELNIKTSSFDECRKLKLLIETELRNNANGAHTWVPSEGGADAIMTPSEALALNEKPKAVPCPRP